MTSTRAILDFSDAIYDLELFLLGSTSGGDTELPCGGAAGGFENPANLAFLDVNSDAVIDFSDAVYILIHVILGGPEPSQGTDCILVPDCPDSCSQP